MYARGLSGLVWDQDFREFESHHPDIFLKFKTSFLDFLIEKNGKKIDLEIDGKQHEIKERKEHDEERDKYLTDNGYIVYRVPWNDIKTEEGKLQMKEKIEKFLNFYITLI